jgi:mycothiol synthase
MIQTHSINTLPTPPDLSGYTWRSLRREDVPVVHQLLLAVDEADDREVASTLEDAIREYDDPWCTPETDSLVALTGEGQIVAFARTFLNPQPEEANRCFLWVEVHPDWRGRGLEDGLIDWAEARGRQRLLAVNNSLPCLLRWAHQDTQTDRIARLEGRGYRPERYFFRMRRDLREPIPDLPLPEGITLRTFTPGMSSAVLSMLNEAFRDHWSFEFITDEDWQKFFIERSSFRPDVTFLAMDGGDIAGVSFNTISPEENARNDIKEGWVAELAVRRPWRKRGIATALLYASMRAFEREGLDYATLGVDAENLTGALRLYERVGFVAVKRFIQMAKPVNGVV